MKVRLMVNIGSIDAAAHGLAHDKCQAGAEIDVSDAAGSWLVNSGHAEVVGVGKAAEVKGIPKRDAKADK